MLLEALPEELREHEPNLYRVVKDGLALFMERFGDRRAGMTTRSERSNMHDCMREVALKLFPAHCHQRGNLFLICIGTYRIKLKKFAPSLSTSNYPTQAVFDFLRQVVHDLFDAEPVINLHLGYVPQGLAVAGYPVWMTRPKGLGAHDWHYEMSAITVAAMPSVPPPTDPNIAAKQRVKAKPSKIRKIDQSDRE